MKPTTVAAREGVPNPTYGTVRISERTGRVYYWSRRTALLVASENCLSFSEVGERLRLLSAAASDDLAARWSERELEVFSLPELVPIFRSEYHSNENFRSFCRLSLLSGGLLAIEEAWWRGIADLVTRVVDLDTGESLGAKIGTGSDFVMHPTGCLAAYVSHVDQFTGVGIVDPRRPLKLYTPTFGVLWIIWAHAFSPDGAKIAFVGECDDQEIVLTCTFPEFRTLYFAMTPLCAQPPCRAVAFSDDSSAIFCSSADGRLLARSCVSGDVLESWPMHSDKIVSYSFNHASGRLVTLGNDGVIRLWDTGLPSDRSEALPGSQRAAERFVAKAQAHGWAEPSPEPPTRPMRWLGGYSGWM
jgi:WD40 repeat protein